MGLLALLVNPNTAVADHATPERVVEGKYVVVLLLTPQGEAMRMRFLFRDIKTGRNLLVPIVFRFTIKEKGLEVPVYKSTDMSTENAIGEFVYKFPRGGLYEIVLEFEKADELEKVYRPDDWSIWVPGQTYNPFGRYPIGFAEIAGFIAFFTALLIFVGSIWWKKKKGKPFEIKFFGK